MVLRLAFMGTPDFAVPALSELIAAGHEVVAVYTQPPRRAGRGKKEQQSPVHAFAEAQGLDVCAPQSMKAEDEVAAFAALDIDVGIVVAYGQILPQAVLDAPTHGCLNLHGSLLPRWRGAAPIERAVMAGDKETGVMVMQMEAGLDTGPVLLGEQVTIGAHETSGALRNRLSGIGASLLVRALSALERGALVASPQPEEGVTYAKKIEKAEAEINWDRSAEEIDQHIRGLTPFPGAWFAASGEKEPIRIKVLEAMPVAGSGAPGTLLAAPLTIACAQGALEITRVQRAGKQACSAEDFARGFPLTIGEKVS